MIETSHASTAWAQVPRPPEAPGRSRPVALAILAFVALVGPVVRAGALPASRPETVFTIGLLAVAATALVPARWWPVRAAIALLAGALLIGNQGELIAIWLAAGLVLGSWVGLLRPPAPGVPTPSREAALPVAALCAVAAWVGSEELRTWEPLVPFALACAFPVLSRFGGGAVLRWAARLGALAGHAVAAVAFWLLGLLAVIAPWAVQRVLRIDPLDPRQGWVDRDRRALQAAQPWAPDPAADPPPRSLPRRLLVPVLAVIGVVAAAVWLWPEDVGPGRTEVSSTASGVALGAPADPDAVPAAQEGNGWYRDYVEDITWLLNEKVALRPLEVYRLIDAETRTVTIRDGYRESWTADACGCRRVRVWLYGGGGAFGFGQRDDHTIASELARAASDDGIVVDVENRGIPGQLHWRAALRFANDLSVADEPPDLVVFYEGAEEIEGAEYLDDPPVGDIRPPREPFLEDIYDELVQDAMDSGAPYAEPDEVPDGVVFPGLEPVDELSPAEVGELAATRFGRSRQMSDDTAAYAGIPVVYAWQPSRYTRADREPDSGDGTEVDDRRAASFAAASAALGDDVVDLTDALDDLDGPVFTDDVHHNEEAARAIAAALYERLAPRLRAVAGVEGG